MQHHVVICDDEADVRETLGAYLTKRGYDVHLVPDGAALVRHLEAKREIDTLLLDIRMPGVDGLSVLRDLPADRTFAVIMVTAAGETIDRVLGLELGADDYLPKPVDLRELEARVKAAARRKDRLSAAAPAATEAPKTLRFAGLVLDVEGARLVREDGEEIDLTAMEYQLLKVFIEHRGRVLNRDQLLELAHDRGWDPFDRSIDIRISRLRRKIEPHPSKPVIIRTVRGIGYISIPTAAADDPSASPKQSKPFVRFAETRLKRPRPISAFTDTPQR